MKLKNVLYMGLSLVLVAAVSIGGTVAFLTSTDSDVNIMTAGNVNIAQNEYQYNRETNGFDAFENNKPALPAVFNNGIVNEDGTVTTNPAWQLDDNDQQVALTFPNTDSDPFKIWSQNDHNIIDKFVTVKNNGKTAVYFRTIIAFEMGNIPINGADAGDYGARFIRTASNYGEGTINGNTVKYDYTREYLLDPNLTYEKGKSNDFQIVDINGQNYIVMTWTHNEPLAAGAESSPSLRQFHLGHGVTSDMIESLGTNWEVIALSQAVQADGFQDADNALKAGFGEVTAENVAKWFKDIAPTNARS